jgi:hypothetical protein
VPEAAVAVWASVRLPWTASFAQAFSKEAVRRATPDDPRLASDLLDRERRRWDRHRGKARSGPEPAVATEPVVPSSASRTRPDTTDEIRRFFMSPEVHAAVRSFLSTEGGVAGEPPGTKVTDGEVESERCHHAPDA